MTNVMIQYTLNPEVSLDETLPQIKSFVEHMKSASSNVRYTSYRRQDAERSFIHVGYFPDEPELKEIQSQAWFGEFSAFLKPRCAEGPSVTRMNIVASTL